MKKKSKGPLLIIIILILVVGMIFGGYYGYSTITQLQFERSELEATIRANTQPVYVAISEIHPGDIFFDAANAPTEDLINIEIQNITTGLEPEYYMGSDSIGKESIGYIDYGTPILKYLATEAEEVAKDDRDYEICVSELMTNQALYDYVDVRIMFPDGSDYLLLAKKRINSLNLKNCIWQTVLNEEEILRMTSATIDAYVYAGARIYTTRYVERTLQEEAIPNYPIKETTLMLLNEDPNILTKATHTLNVEARTALEERLGEMDSDTISHIIQGMSENSTAQKNVITSEVENADVVTYEDAF